MKTLIWKIRYAVKIKKLLCLSLPRCWEMAGITVEDYGDDIEIWTPEQSCRS